MISAKVEYNRKLVALPVACFALEFGLFSYQREDIAQRLDSGSGSLSRIIALLLFREIKHRRIAIFDTHAEELIFSLMNS